VARAGTAEPTGGLGVAATLALLAGPLLSMVDSNVVNVAIPDITRDLRGSLTSVQWTVSGYLLALAATLPATSFLAKRLGTVRVYAVSLAGFTLASVLCAFASNVPELVGARVAQGVLAAPLVPLSMSLTLGRRDRIPTSAGIVLFLGPALGPTIGGLLVSAWGWPAIFLVNAPIGVAALAAVPVLRRRGVASERDRAARFDPAGLALLSGGLVLSIYGTGQGPTSGWGSARSWPFWAAGLLLICGYGWWARGREHPAVDLRLLRRPQSALAVALCTLTAVAMFSVLFLLPVLLQDIQGHGALASGLVLLPQGLVMGLSTRCGMALGERGWGRRGIVAGLIAIGATTGLLLFVTMHTPLWIVSAVMAGRGLGIGLVIQPLLLAMLAGLSASQLADANTLFNVGQRLGGSIGVGLLATFFTLRVTARVRDAFGPAASRLGTGSLASAPPPVRPRLADAAMAGFHDTIWVGVGIAAVGVLCALFLRPAVLAGDERPEHGTAEQPKTATTQASPA
jgi:EmrB/QacA subfamily drug resistance transporter